MRDGTVVDDDDVGSGLCGYRTEQNANGFLGMCIVNVLFVNFEQFY
jgi:hypothetical protein